jgi:hypothetical protein
VKRRIIHELEFLLNPERIPELEREAKKYLKEGVVFFHPPKYRGYKTFHRSDYLFRLVRIVRAGRERDALLQRLRDIVYKRVPKHQYVWDRMQDSLF